MSVLYDDPLYVEPFVDADEWRDSPAPHRYIHGGFADTELRFSVYLPPAEQYGGRFFQPLMHIAGDENVAPSGELGGLGTESLEFAFASGGYLVESNQGSTLMMGPPDITGFRASAASAQFARTLAVEMYGEHRPYGYVFGGSGGAYKTMACIENTDGIWDGSVPFIHGSHVSLPNVFTVAAHALRVLDGRFDDIVDAIDPGGSGDMYAGLDDEQRGALEEVTRMGFPPRAWFAHERLALSYTGVFAAIFGTVATGDPTYFEDFWTVPGYLGADPPPSLEKARLRYETSISDVLTTDEVRSRGLPVSIAAGTRSSAPAAFRLADPTSPRAQGAFLSPTTGAAAGERLMITGVIDDLVMLGFGGGDIARLEQLAPGDSVVIDNGDYLAAQTYHRHQDPGPEYAVWDQFKNADGAPIHPVRPLIAGFDQVGEGNSWQSGRFSGKVITVNSMMDEAAYPWQAAWYHSRAKAVWGDTINDRYRLWFVDHAMHVNPSRYMSPTEGAETAERDGPTDTRVVNYTGVLHQALGDLIAWVEDGIEPPATTAYNVVDGQIVLPATAHERRGVQPVVNLTVVGGDRIDVEVGARVEFAASIETPPGAGVITTVEWDYDGSGTFGDRVELEDPAPEYTAGRTHAFTTRGTFFVTVRATSQREDSLGTLYGCARNLARVRVVVS
jgi:hypothetical protein